MELFKLRYNLYKYLIKENFKFDEFFKNLLVLKNLSYIIIIFFILIFIIGFEYLNYFIIFFIIILILYIYNVEIILLKLEQIKTNKNFQIYYNYYIFFNKLFNINIDNINQIDGFVNLKQGDQDGKIYITNIELIYSGVGYTPNKEYKIRKKGIDTDIAKVKSLSDGRISDKIYDLTSDIEYNPISDNLIIYDNDIDIKPISNATFKVYYSKIISKSNIREYSLSFMNIYNNIIRNIGYTENILKEDIKEHINILKKENDLLKYIDVYDIKYDFLKKNIIINKIKNEKIFNFLIAIDDIIHIINEDTFLINLEELEKYKNENKKIYSKFITEFELKDLTLISNHNINLDKNILKLLEDFDTSFNYLIIILIIIFTIILHIFYINLY